MPAAQRPLQAEAHGLGHIQDVHEVAHRGAVGRGKVRAPHGKPRALQKRRDHVGHEMALRFVRLAVVAIEARARHVEEAQDMQSEGAFGGVAAENALQAQVQVAAEASGPFRRILERAVQARVAVDGAAGEQDHVGDAESRAQFAEHRRPAHAGGNHPRGPEALRPRLEGRRDREDRGVEGEVLENRPGLRPLLRLGRRQIDAIDALRPPAAPIVHNDRFVAGLDEVPGDVAADVAPAARD